MNASLPTNIAVLGPGLLGGSLLLALRERLPGSRLRAWARREAAVQELRDRGLADVTSTVLEEVVEGADFVVMCTPIEHMADLAGKLLHCPVQPGCVVTDVGSVKAPVVFAVEAAFAGSTLHFLGSHPMAGSEKAGLQAARPDLFEGANCLITPTLLTDTIALQATRALWQFVGCRVKEMSPEEHDRNVARISHMPHLAAAVVALAALHEDPAAVGCIGNGFRDTTRVASGDPDLWQGILLANRTEVVSAVADARDRFNELLAMLEKMDDKALRRFLRDAKTLRDGVPACS